MVGSIDVADLAMVPNRANIPGQGGEVLQSPEVRHGYSYIHITNTYRCRFVYMQRKGEREVEK